MSEFKLNVSAYLNRIGISGIPAPTEENLKLLTRAHLEAVPFENLEACREHRVPSLAPADLLRKVVENRRGGWCFELNKLFCLLLTELGYTCRSVPSRVVYEMEGPCPVSHQATVVEVDGHLWFCDVGFGDNGPRGALRADITEPQTVFGGTFRIEPDHSFYPGEYMLSVYFEDHWVPVLTFQDHSTWLDPDYAQLNTLYTVDPASFFGAVLFLFRCTPSGWIELMKNHLTRMENGQLHKEDLTEAQIEHVIESEFGLYLN